MNAPEKTKIFIVDDNFVYSYVLEAMLLEYGNIKVTTFTTGESCIELLDNNPALIILDYNLDGQLNGAETFKLIHERKPKIPVIILSGQLDVQVVADLLKLGVYDYIQKQDRETTFKKIEQSVLKVLGLK